MPGGVERRHCADGPGSRPPAGIYPACAGPRGVRSAHEPRTVCRPAKCAPPGERGAGGALPHLEYRPFPTAEANAAINDATMVIVQFECADAVDKADEIAAVEGVDMVLVGVNDLLADLGLAGQFEHPRAR